MSLKCDPDFAAALVREHPAITPGYHLNKRHWITLDLGGDLPDELAEDLLVDSYDLVVDGLPKSRRPLARDRRAAPTTASTRNQAIPRKEATFPKGAATAAERPTGRSDGEASASASLGDLRELVSHLPEVTESSHHEVTDFRVRGRIFATMPSIGVLALRLAPEQQAELIATDPESFTPAAGSWGRQGWTRVQTARLTLAELGELLADAWARRAPLTLARQLTGED
ncbi:MAG TPA: MmcQ/YjbR family DNA-binding protein [Kineosporiaceae bacterium]|nr:MmcQ/YjbR family DNA-binding protein [Kineosporiaceae bacterium]